MKMKRIISMLLCAVMLIGLLPTVAWAEEGTQGTQQPGTLTISVMAAENASVTVSYQFLNESGTVIGTSQTYSTPVQYADETSKVVVSVTTEETLKGVNLSGTLYYRPEDDTLMTAFSGENKSYTFSLGNISDTIELTLNYTDTPINNNPGGEGGSPSETHTVDFGTGSWTVGEQTVTADRTGTINALKMDDVITLTGFNADTMQAQLVALDGFTTTLNVVDGKTSLSAKNCEGLPDGTLQFSVVAKQTGGQGPDDPPNPPQVSTGDIALTIENSQSGTVYYKVGESTENWTGITVNPFTLRASDELNGIAKDTKIYFKATPNGGQKVDDGDGRNRVRYDDTDYNISHTELENGTYFLTYDPEKTYSMQIAFMSEGGNTPTDQEGKLEQDVTLNVYEYKIDRENGGYQTISQPDRPDGFMIESFKLNDFECFLQQNATVTFVNGGYALNSDQKNTLSFRESFGSKAKAIYLVNVAENGSVTKIPGSDFKWNPNAETTPAGNIGRWELTNITPAESYNVAVVEGVSDDLTVIWTTDYETAAKWNPDGSFATDMYVEHGRVEVASIKRGNDTLYDGHQVTEGATGVGVNITDKFGYVTLTRGDTVTLKLIPDYGYQLKSVGAVDESMTADENEVSTFTIENIQNNIRFSSAFEKSEDEIVIAQGSTVTDATIENGRNATGSGNLKLTVEDITDTEGISDELKNLGSNTLYLDMNLYQVVSKGTGNANWETQLQDLNGTITVTLKVPAPAEGNSYYIIREHGDGDNKTYERIEVDYDAATGTVTFETDKFSNYALAQEKTPIYVPPTPPASNNTTTETVKNPDGSTTTTVTDKTTGTVTETTKNTDGSTTVVETKKDGTVTETVKVADGTTGTVVTDKSGTVTEVKASVSSTAVKEAEKAGAAVTLPVEVPAANTTGDAPAVQVTVPKSTDSIKVEVPVEKVTPGTVAVIVKADGAEEIVKNSKIGENGVVIKLDGDITVKIVDNSKDFADVETDWSKEGIDYVSSRRIFEGTATTIFEPETNMTRAMLMTVLARYDGEDTNGGTNWYEKGMEWAMTAGISDGTNPTEDITRQDMIAMLYRYARSPESTITLDFPDADNVSDYAQAAMRWAVEKGLIKGMDGNLNPEGLATRAQVAAVMMRFCENVQN